MLEAYHKRRFLHKSSSDSVRNVPAAMPKTFALVLAKRV